MNIQVLLDMDGVLVNFVKGALKAHNINISVNDFYKGHEGEWNIVPIIQKYIPGFTDNKFWEPMNDEYWANLEPMEDFEEILSLLEERFDRSSITICTSPSENEGCIPGKRRWIKKYMPSHYHRTYAQNFGPKKWLMAHRRHILVDDHNKNCREFVDYGGHAASVPRLWNSNYLVANCTLEYLDRQIEAILKGIS